MLDSNIVVQKAGLKFVLQEGSNTSAGLISLIPTLVRMGQLKVHIDPFGCPFSVNVRKQDTM